MMKQKLVYAESWSVDIINDYLERGWEIKSVHPVATHTTNTTIIAAYVVLQKIISKQIDIHYVKINGERKHYLRKDLQKWANYMDEIGQDYFYTTPKDPEAPDGKLVLCDAEGNEIVGI